MKKRKLLFLAPMILGMVACEGGAEKIANDIKKIAENTNNASDGKVTIVTTIGEDSGTVIIRKSSDKIAVDLTGAGKDGMYFEKKDNKWYTIMAYGDEDTYLRTEIEGEPDFNLDTTSDFDFANNAGKFDYKDNTYTLKDGETITYVDQYESYDDEMNEIKVDVTNTITKFTLKADSEKRISEIEYEATETSDGESETCKMKITYDYSKQEITVPEGVDMATLLFGEGGEGLLGFGKAC